jgi:hypothetical protein
MAFPKFTAAAFAASLLLSGAAFAQAIESEPLPPISGQTTSPSQAVTPTLSPQDSVIPIYNPNRPPSSSSTAAPEDDMGMNGASVYDLQKQGKDIPLTPPPDMSGERDMNSPTSMPAENTAAPEDTGPVADAPHSIPYGGSIGNAPPAKYSYDGKKFCTMKMTFTGMGKGIDENTATAVKSYLDENQDKLTYVRSAVSPEGEFSYCVDVEDHRNKAEVYRQLKKLLPAKSPNSAETILSGSGFATVTAR